MGRPIKKKWFGENESLLTITAKLPGIPAGDGHIVSQTGTTKYMVEINGEQGIVLLMDTDDPNELQDGQAFILAVTADGQQFPIAKLHQHLAVVSDGNLATDDDLELFAWSDLPAYDDTNIGLVSADKQPDNPATTYVTSVSGTAITAIELFDKGSSWEATDEIIVTGGSGTGANFSIASTLNGKLESVNIDDGGTGYAEGDQLLFTSVPIQVDLELVDGTWQFARVSAGEYRASIDATRSGAVAHFILADKSIGVPTPEQIVAGTDDADNAVIQSLVGSVTGIEASAIFSGVTADQYSVYVAISEDGVPVDSFGGLYDFVNSGPTVTINSPATSEVNNSYTLTASITDADNDSLDFQWTQLAGSPVTINNPTSQTASFVAPATAGVVTFQVDVTDGMMSASDTHDITVADNGNVSEPINDIPVVSIDSVAEQVTSDSVTLTGSFVDTDAGDSHTQTWTQLSGPAITFDSPYSLVTDVTLSATPGNYSFRLTVNDGTADGFADVSFEAVAVASPLVANITTPTNANSEDWIKLTTDSVDDNNIPLTYVWTQTSGTTVTMRNDTTNEADFYAPDANESLGFNLEISNGTHTATDDIVINVSQTAKVQQMSEQLASDAMTFQTWTADADVVTMEVYPTNGNAGLPVEAPAVTNGSLQTIGWLHTGQMTSIGAGFEGIIKSIKLGDDRHYVVNDNLVENRLADNTNLALNHPPLVFDGSEPGYTYISVLSGIESAYFDLRVTMKGHSTGTCKVRFSFSNLVGDDLDAEENFTKTPGNLDDEVFTHRISGGSTLQFGNQYGAAQFIGEAYIELRPAAADAEFTTTGWDTYTEQPNGDWLGTTANNVPLLPFVNTPPIAEITSAILLDEETNADLTVSAIDINELDSLSYSWSQKTGPVVTINNGTTANASFTTPAVTGDPVDLIFECEVSDSIDVTTVSTTITVIDTTPVTVTLAADTDFTTNKMAADVRVLDTNGFIATIDVVQLYQLQDAPAVNTYDIVDTYNSLRLGDNIPSGNAPSRIGDARAITAVIEADGRNDDISEHNYGYDQRIAFQSQSDLGYGGMHWAKVPVSRNGWALYGGYQNLSSRFEEDTYVSNNIAMMKIEDATSNIWRIASTMSKYVGEYRDEAPAAFDAYGNTLYWSSNWGGTLDHREAFLVELPPTWADDLNSGNPPASYVINKDKPIDWPGNEPYVAADWLNINYTDTFTLTGDHSAAATYALGDAVKHNDRFYANNVAIGAGEAFDHAKWNEIAPCSMAEIRGKWKDDEAYAIGDIAVHNYFDFYQCNTTISTGEAFDPAKWDLVSVASAPAQGEERMDYYTGMLVKRISDASMLADTDDAFIQYSRYTPENTGGEYVIVTGGNSITSWVINKSDGSLVNELVDSTGGTIGENHEVRWDTSGAFPNRIYYVIGTSFYYIPDISVSNVSILIKDFGSSFAGMELLRNDVEGDCSLDSDHWVWMARFYGDGAVINGTVVDDNKTWVLGFIHYQISTDTTHTMGPADFVGSNLDALKDEDYVSPPNMVEMSPDGTRIVLHYGAKFGTSNKFVNTWMDGSHAWPIDFDWNTTVPTKVSISETHSGWSGYNGNDAYISQNSRDDGMDSIELGEQALSSKVNTLDLNGRTVSMTAAQQAAVSIELNGGSVLIV